jgi:mercuric ion transport protein
MKTFKSVVLGTLALVTCPCHLPLLLVLLAGTSAGAWIGRNQGLAYGLATAVFAVSGYLLWHRMTDEGSAKR